MIKEIKVVGVESLAETLAYIEGRKEILATEFKNEKNIIGSENLVDIGWVKGQEYAKTRPGNYGRRFA